MASHSATVQKTGRKKRTRVDFKQIAFYPSRHTIRNSRNMAARQPRQQRIAAAQTPP